MQFELLMYFDIKIMCPKSSNFHAKLVSPTDLLLIAETLLNKFNHENISF